MGGCAYRAREGVADPAIAVAESGFLAERIALFVVDAAFLLWCHLISLALRTLMQFGGVRGPDHRPHNLDVEHFHEFRKYPSVTCDLGPALLLLA